MLAKRLTANVDAPAAFKYTLFARRAEMLAETAPSDRRVSLIFQKNESFGTASVPSAFPAHSILSGLLAEPAPTPSETPPSGGSSGAGGPRAGATPAVRYLPKAERGPVAHTYPGQPPARRTSWRRPSLHMDW